MRTARLAVLFCLDSPLQRPDIGGILRLRSTGRELWRTERFFNRRGVNGGVADSLDEARDGERRMPKDESEAFYQMLEALMSARRYILAQQYSPPEVLAEIDAAIRRAEAEQHGHLAPED